MRRTEEAWKGLNGQQWSYVKNWVMDRAVRPTREVLKSELMDSSPSLSAIMVITNCRVRSDPAKVSELVNAAYEWSLRNQHLIGRNLPPSAW